MRAALLPLAFVPLGVGHDEVTLEPTRGVLDDRLQGTRFRKEMARAWNYFDRFRSRQHRERLLVQLDHAEIAAAHNQQGRVRTRFSAGPARSGRPPRDTIAPMRSPSRAAAASAAAAPVLAPKNPRLSPDAAGAHGRET